MAVKVDLSSLRKLDERLSTKEQRREVDLLTAQGFTFYEGHTPFDNEQEALPQQPSEPPRSDSASQTKESKPAQGNASETASRPQREPLYYLSSTRSKTAIMREAFNFWKRNSPPTVDVEYWKTHKLGDATPESENEYWAKVSEDCMSMGECLGGDSLLQDFVRLLFVDLESEYEQEKNRIISENQQI